MTTRTSGESVTFLHPFRLSGADDVQPAGRYVVETDEEPLHSLSLHAHRRIATFIHLAGRPDSGELARVVDIDPTELATALATDAQLPDAVPTQLDGAATGEHAGEHDRTAGAKDVLLDGWRHWLVLNAIELRWTALVLAGVALAGVFA